MHDARQLLWRNGISTSISSHRAGIRGWLRALVILGFLAACLLPMVSSAASLLEIFEGSGADKKNALEVKNSNNRYISPAEHRQIIQLWRDRQRAAEKEREDCQHSTAKFPQQLAELQRKLALLAASSTASPSPSPHLNALQRQQQMLQTSDALVRHNQQLQELTANLRKIAAYLESIPGKIVEFRQTLEEADVERRTLLASTDHTTPEEEILLAKVQCYAAQLKNLECRHTHYQKKLEITQLEAEYVYRQHQQLVQQQQVFSRSGDVAQADSALAQCLQRNQEYSSLLGDQERFLEQIVVSQLQVTRDIGGIKQEINKIFQLVPSLSSSPALREMLRAKILKLTAPPNLQHIDQKIAQLNVQRLLCEDALQNDKRPSKTAQTNGRANQDTQALEKELARERQLLIWLTRSSEAAIIALSQLKDANIELVCAQQQLKKVAARHLFWTTDVNRASLIFPVNIVKDINKLLQKDVQFLEHLQTIFSTGDNIVALATAVTLAVLGWSARRRYHDFLQRAAACIGNVTHDNFRLTTSMVGWSLLMALPLPMLVAAVGYCLKDCAEAVAIGVLATIPLLWALGTCASFSHPQGLFIKHFGWEQQRVARVARHYMLVTWLVVPLVTMTIVFNHLDNRQFAGTLGRSSFMLLCAVLAMFTLSINRAGLTFYRNRRGAEQNIISRAVWAVLMSAPLLAIFFSALGYLAAAQELLLRLAGSVGIWFGMLIIYRLVWRWMLIQRRRIAFDRAKQRRAGKLAQRAREEDLIRAEHNLEMQLLDLDTISSRSLQLLRSMITMATLVSLIWWWSKMHPAFGFLETVQLWSVESASQGEHSVQSITLGRGLMIVILVVITTQLVRNLPALLELALLQHLDLSPGTSYAITTLTKYLIVLTGGLIGISLLGIDWPKIQWVATALGVGLGFGLKDIFANFISSLILLFEKPLRIGDTITVRDLTGTVTKINTRATVITDWDRKEVIVPNHALITEQFINWTLADAITRIVLQIGAPADADPLFIKKLIKRAAKNCPLSLDNPPPEIYLNELQQGIQNFEVRLYAAEPGHRMPLRHGFHQRLLALYRRYHIILPYPPTQIRIESVGAEDKRLRSKTTARKSGAEGIKEG